MTKEEVAEAQLLFLLKGGKRTKVPANAKKKLTDRQWYRKTRDDNNETVVR